MVTTYTTRPQRIVHRNSHSRAKLHVQHLEERLAPAFVPLGGEFQVNSWTTGLQINKAVAMDAGGNFVVAFNSVGQDGSGDGIFAQKYNAAGMPLGNDFRVNSVTTSEQSYPSVAMNSSGSFVVAWEGLDGSSSGVFAQRYNAAGTPQGGEFRVNVETGGRQGGPVLAVEADGDFVLAWFSVGQDGSGEAIYARRYNADGIAQGNEFRVNSFTSGNQSHPGIAIDAVGNFVIVWSSQAQDDGDADAGGVYFQRFNASANPSGGEVRANSFTIGDQAAPAVAMDSDGDFAIAWISNGQDGSGYGVFGQRFNSSGMPQGSEIRANTFTTNSQGRPSIAMDAAGNYVISWHSEGQDGDSRGVYAQRYNSSGSMVGIEIQVNTWASNNQSRPKVAVDAMGDAVIAWDSSGQDGDNYGIYAQRFGYRNVAPTFVLGSDQFIGVNAGSQSVSSWATNIAPGPADESNQNVNFEIIGNSNPALFAIAPTISSDGTLMYTPAANLYGTANIQVRLHDDGGTANGGVDVSLTAMFSITILPPPQVNSIRINDGGVQRSRVSSLTVEFDRVVNIVGAPTSVFQVNRVNGGAVLLGVTLDEVNGKSSVGLSFSGSESIFGSLQDGRYTFVIFGMQIQDTLGQSLQGNGPTGNNFTFEFHRLYGDADGDGTVSAADFNAFRLVYGTGPSIFDFDNDGATTAADFNNFRTRYGVTI